KTKDRPRWQVAVEFVRSELHARGTDGTEAGRETLLFGDAKVVGCLIFSADVERLLHFSSYQRDFKRNQCGAAGDRASHDPAWTHGDASRADVDSGVHVVAVFGIVRVLPHACQVRAFSGTWLVTAGVLRHPDFAHYPCDYDPAAGCHYSEPRAARTL